MALPELLRAHLQLASRAWTRVGIHCHDHDEVLLVVRGRYRSNVAGESFDLGPGEAVWYPAGCRHQPDADGLDTGDGRWQYVAFRAPSPVDDAPVRRTVDRGGRLHMLCTWLDELHLRGDTSALSGHLLASLCASFLSTDSESPVGPGRFDQLPAYIDRQMAYPITVEEMAAFVGLPRRRFERQFRSTFGLSPKAWLQQRRTARAIERLQQSTDSLTTIAAEVGFQSVAALRKRIAATGRTAAQWQQCS